MSNLKKHRILKELYKHWKEGEDKTSSTFQITPYGRSLSVIELEKKTKIKTEIIERLCIVLSEEGFIKMLKEDIDNKAHRYIITPSGQRVFIDKFYRNKFWFYNYDFWKWSLPFIIACIGLLNSIFRWWVTK